MSDDFGSTPQPTYIPPPPPPSSGLSDSAAGAIAYITIIPAILFLLIDPYKDKPFVKFHCFQCLGLALVWICLHVILIIPFLGWLVYIVGGITLFVMWLICILKASQGGAFKLPLIGKFAADQSGYAA